VADIEAFTAFTLFFRRLMPRHAATCRFRVSLFFFFEFRAPLFSPLFRFRYNASADATSQINIIYRAVPRCFFFSPRRPCAARCRLPILYSRRAVYAYSDASYDMLMLISPADADVMPLCHAAADTSCRHAVTPLFRRRRCRH